MKITGNQGVSVNLSAARELGSLLKNINPGDSISVTVIKSEGSRALLDLGGRIITAEFTNGVPAEKNIDLVLKSKTADTIRFSLKDNNPADNLVRLLSPFAVLKEEDSIRNSLQNLARFINASRPDIAEINMFLLGLKKDEQKGKDAASLFNRLLLKGVPGQVLIDLGYLLYSRYNPLLFMSYRYMLQFAGKKAFTSERDPLSSFEESSDLLCRILKDDDTDFSLMLRLLFDDDQKSGVSGELAVPVDENFVRLEYIINENTVFFNFDLTAAGQLGVFVKSEKESVTINFLSGRDDLLVFMKEKEGQLKEMLENNGIKKSIIGFFDTKKIVDKLELWSLDFYTKSGFSVKA